MKAILLLLSLIFVAFGCQQPHEPHNHDTVALLSPDDEAKLRYLKEVEWPKAYREQDTVLLDRILGEDFQMINDSGGWYTKQDELAWIKEHATQHDSFYYEIKRLEVLPNGTAIICGTGHMINFHSSNPISPASGQEFQISAL